MAGYIHVIRTDVANGTYGTPVAEYQLTYTTRGNSWVRSFHEGALEEFLFHDVALPADTTAEVMKRVRLHGNATIPDVEIRESEAGAMGLKQMPTDRV